MTPTISLAGCYLYISVSAQHPWIRPKQYCISWVYRVAYNPSEAIDPSSDCAPLSISTPACFAISIIPPPGLHHRPVPISVQHRLVYNVSLVVTLICNSSTTAIITHLNEVTFRMTAIQKDIEIFRRLRLR